MVTLRASHLPRKESALHRWTLLTLALFSLLGCGEQAQNTASESTNQDNAATDSDELSEAFGGGQGGGTLVFEGSEYAIESALCYLDPPVEVGTVGNGYRIVIGGTERYPSISIVDSSMQWVAVDKTFTVTGSTVSAELSDYRNNSDDRVVQASFVIECP